MIAVCSKLNQHVQMKVAERGMSNSDEEFQGRIQEFAKRGPRPPSLPLPFFLSSPSPPLRRIAP